jgi:hypothetical protein
MGNVTRQYPIIIKVKALPGIRTAGETQYFFKANNLAQTAAANGQWEEWQERTWADQLI